ncbi:MAG TPA: hypothetical protein VIG94_05665 [Faecalibacter sp.]
MRKLLFQIIFLGNIFVYAQVGIGTDSPLATLHVKENRNPTTNRNDINSTDGIIIPKISKLELALKLTSAYYPTSHEGTIIYINNIDGIITGPSEELVDQINTIGFYYFSNNGKWLPISKRGNDETDDAWINFPSAQRIELGTTSTGLKRSAGTEVVLTDTGSIGINTTTPSKRLHLNLASEFNSSDTFRITNLKSDPPIERSLVINNEGYIGIKTEENVRGQIQRFPIVPIPSLNTSETRPILINADINSSSNTINTITDEFIPSSTKTGISLPAGIYKLEVKIIGYFNAANVRNSVEVKTLVNGVEYSSQNYGSNTNIAINSQNYNGFTTMDFIELKAPAEIDFVIKNNVNSFTLVDYIQDANQRIYGSLILIQRLK